MKGFNALIIAPGDNVAVALRDISQEESLLALSNIPVKQTGCFWHTKSNHIFLNSLWLVK